MHTQENMLEQAIAHFRYLNTTFRPIAGRRGQLSNAQVEEFRQAQQEMYRLAQVICRIVAPAIQEELDQVRRDIAEELRDGPEDRGYFVKPTLRGNTHRFRWFEHQLTPELSASRAITGKFVSKRNTQRLIRAHKAQVQAVSRAIGM